MKQYSYFIQIGTWPHNVTFACASAPIYHTADEASVAAFDYLTKVRGIGPGKVSTKWIHTRSHRLARRAEKAAKKQMRKSGEIRLTEHLRITPHSVDKRRDRMPVTMCGKKTHAFNILTTRNYW